MAGQTAKVARSNSGEVVEEAVERLGDVHARERNSQLDGSYGYHQFREIGKFGSHPGHDAHHDESWP